jgi:hypothetical protein
MGPGYVRKVLKAWAMRLQFHLSQVCQVNRRLRWYQGLCGMSREDALFKARLYSSIDSWLVWMTLQVNACLIAPCWSCGAWRYYICFGDDMAVRIVGMKLRPVVYSMLGLKISSKLWNEDRCRFHYRLWPLTWLRRGQYNELCFWMDGSSLPCVDSHRHNMWNSVVGLYLDEGHRGADGVVSA